MELPEPVTAEARELRLRVSAARWSRVVVDAVRRAEVVEGVVRQREESGQSWRKCVVAFAPEVGWSAYLHWRRRYDGRTGPAWERLLDTRLPPPTPPIPVVVRQAACLLRRMDRGIGPEKTRALLSAQYGPSGKVSDATLRRIWAAEGLSYEPSDRAGHPPGEEVVLYHGGGGLALLAAAEVETGAFGTLAAAVLAAGRRSADEQGEVEAEEPWEGERDERGRFTGVYNDRWGAMAERGTADARFDADAEKRRQRALADLPLLDHRPATLGRKLLGMGLVPLLTERRGFDGLDGPAGAWLGVLGGVAYMPATLDKALGAVGLLGVHDALWDAHARTWHEVARRWSASGPAWLQWVTYVDTTQDPYWTRRFAKSGKVSRVGQVMPCLTRVTVTSGPGVPLLVETVAGTASLKSRLLPVLRRLDLAVGAGEVGRLTVVDSEVGTAGVLWAMQGLDRWFITVVKGQVLKGAERTDEGDCQRFRDRDTVRELSVLLRGKGAPEEGVRLRGVEMQRAGGRHPTSTLFVTNAPADGMSTSDVPTAYLSRWPHQEQVFRDGRNGGGLNRSHGYGGGTVAHVALRTKLEDAERRAVRTEAARVEAENTHGQLRAARGSLATPALGRKAVALAERDLRKKTAAAEKARQKLEGLRTTPRTIYARDTGRDNAMTCLKAGALLLLEFVLQEYFGGLRMEWRTFIEQFVALPVTMRTSRTQCVVQFHPNPRQAENTARLREACTEINRRALRRDKRTLRYEVLDGGPGS